MIRGELMRPDIACQVHADKAVELTKDLGDAIEKLNELGCIVELEIWFNDGSESVVLHKLTGEMVICAFESRSLTDGKNQG